MVTERRQCFYKLPLTADRPHITTVLARSDSVLVLRRQPVLVLLLNLGHC